MVIMAAAADLLLLQVMPAVVAAVVAQVIPLAHPRLIREAQEYRPETVRTAVELGQEMAVPEDYQVRVVALAPPA